MNMLRSSSTYQYNAHTHKATSARVSGEGKGRNLSLSCLIDKTHASCTPRLLGLEGYVCFTSTFAPSVATTKRMCRIHAKGQKPHHVKTCSESEESIYRKHHNFYGSFANITTKPSCSLAWPNIRTGSGEKSKSRKL